MTLLQASLIALLGYLGSIYGTLLLGTVGGWSIIDHPIVVGTLIGLILGDVKSGVLIGAAVQALYMGLVTPGILVPGDVNFVSYINIPPVLISNTSPEYAVGISVPLGLLGVVAVYGVATFNAVSAHLQDYWTEEGKLKQATRIPIYSNISQLAVRFIPVSPTYYFGTDYAPEMAALVPDQLGVILQMLDGTLPVAGFTLLIRFILKKNTELPYVLVGFTVMAVLKMPIVAVTVLAIFITYLDYLRCVKQS